MDIPVAENNNNNNEAIVKPQAEAAVVAPTPTPLVSEVAVLNGEVNGIVENGTTSTPEVNVVTPKDNDATPVAVPQQLVTEEVVQPTPTPQVAPLVEEVTPTPLIAEVPVVEETPTPAVPIVEATPTPQIQTIPTEEVKPVAPIVEAPVIVAPTPTPEVTVVAPEASIVAPTIEVPETTIVAPTIEVPEASIVAPTIEVPEASIVAPTIDVIQEPTIVAPTIEIPVAEPTPTPQIPVIEQPPVIATPAPAPAEIFSDDILPSYVFRKIEEIVVAEGFSNASIEQAQTNIGDGFVGIIFKVTVSGTRIGANKKPFQDKLNLIVKVPPSNPNRRNNFGSMILFEREVYAYTVIIPEFEQFQKDKNVKETDDGFFGFPKCYAAHFDKEKDEAYIIMNDLSVIGYKLWNKHEPVDFLHTRKLIKELGRFHAISFVMKNQRPDQFRKFTQVQDVMGKVFPLESLAKMGAEAINKAIANLRPDEDYKKDKLINIRDNYVQVLTNATSSDLAEPFAVITHGDCWVNNMMYQYRVSEE